MRIKILNRIRGRVALGCLAGIAAVGLMVFAPEIGNAAQGTERAIASAPTLRYGSTLDAFYAARGGQTLWLSGDRLSQRGERVLKVLEDSWTHGLNPDNYHVAEIKSLSGEALERTMSDGVVRYVRDMTGMRVDPSAVGQKAKYWREKLSAEDALRLVTTASAPADVLDSLAPREKLYMRLRKELIAMAGDGVDGGRAITLGGRTLSPGARHAAVPAIRERLGVKAPAAKADATHYDAALEKAVLDFQKESGLQTDGVIGPRTLAFLNRTEADRVAQIVASMERMRWLEPQRPSRYVLVNIPAATLWGMDNGRAALEMKVVVGKPERPTKSFVATITGVRVNPTWTVPDTIKAKDFLPKLRKNPKFLATKGIVLHRNGEAINPANVDWASVSSSELRQFRMVQPAGNSNALGNVRVLMPNDYDMYLHDTSAPEYFEKTERFYSSGCVRVSQPEALANFIMARESGWSEKGLEKMIASGRTRDIPAAGQMPVYILYQTVWLNGQDQLVFGPDVYGDNADLIRALSRTGQYPFPTDGDESRFAALGEKTAVN